jgi:hypothetical protein
VQKERFTDVASCNSTKGIDVINPAVMQAAKECMIVRRHPPRVGETTPKFDDGRMRLLPANETRALDPHGTARYGAWECLAITQMRRGLFHSGPGLRGVDAVRSTPLVFPGSA